MTNRFGFTKFSIQEFEQWINSLQLARTVISIQQHHTFSPAYVHFKDSNHFELQQGMKNYHVNHNGWSDIGQHFTTFPDGSILSGRSLERSPACITGQNANSICLEHLGNFDSGKDAMTAEQREAIIRMTAILCRRFNLPVHTQSIIYHHWFDLSTGQRNDGVRNNKTCPGTNFFGGNKVMDCNTHFLPLVSQSFPFSIQNKPDLLKYVSVTASKLNVRSEPRQTAKKVAGLDPASIGSVLRVYQEENGWYKISNSQEHWVYGKYTMNVSRAAVKTAKLHVRNGPGRSFDRVGALAKGHEIFIVHEENNWCRIHMDEKWVSKDHLKFILKDLT
ncbi:SH3 domain-containing protein [Daejeonella rubra]|uniref:SH3 domain-containing protein n=1 Tax=Daejeonella rubra TaxID=990371 RepID=UPI000B896AD4|nr:SH3 domain-containing protein [Daejeonella rubra]